MSHALTEPEAAVRAAEETAQLEALVRNRLSGRIQELQVVADR